MKTRMLVLLLAVPYALISALVAAPAPVNSQITAAAVYTDRAIVTRVAKAELAAGEKREIALKFSVEHPADVQVTGLE